MSSPSKRRDMDVMKLMMTDYKVEMVNDSMSDFFVEFKGPTESLYQGGVWRVRVELPEAYPYKSPSIGFVSRIYHPNIDEMSGSVCLDVINQTWSPMFDLVNIFEVFLPQLLLYPNPSDPLNGEAASLMMRDKPSYEQKVKEHCVRYAKPEDILGQDEEEESESEDEKNYSSSDEEMDVEVKDGQEGRRRCMEASRYTWSIAMSKTQGNLKRESHISTYGARKKFVDATCVLQMAEWPLEIDHLSHSEEKKGDQGSSKLKWLTWVFVYFRPTLLGTSLRASSNGAPFDSTAKADDPIIIELPIDTIRGPLKRTRANDPEKVKELMQSIQEIGLQVPIDMLVVDGDYYGFSGCHRYEAHQRLGLQLSDAKFAEEPRRH